MCSAPHSLIREYIIKFFIYCRKIANLRSSLIADFILLIVSVGSGATPKANKSKLIRSRSSLVRAARLCDMDVSSFSYLMYPSECLNSLPLLLPGWTASPELVSGDAVQQTSRRTGASVGTNSYNTLKYFSHFTPHQPPAINFHFRVMS